MQILILSWRDIKNPLSGGAEISTHEHAKNLVRKGHEVIQFSSAFSGAKAKEMIDGIIIIRRGSHYSVHLHAFIYYMRFLRGKIDFIIDEFHFIPFFSPVYFQGKKLAFIHEAAKELWFINQSFPINIIGYLLEPVFFVFYRNVPFLTVSNSTKEDLVKFGVPERNINVIHNGVDVVGINIQKERTPTLIYLGRLARDKGINDVVQAFYIIKKNITNAKLWIVGREEKEGYKDEIKKKASQLRLKNVTFFGYVSEKKKFELLRRSWVLIHPSVKEGWSLTVIEAASQGTPTVGYNISGLRDSIVSGKTGFTVDNKTPSALAEKILYLMKDATIFREISYNAISFSKRFRWNNACKKSAALVEKIAYE